MGLLLPLAAATATAQDRTTDSKTLPSKPFLYEDLPVKVNGQNRSRAVLDGITHKGSAVELHMTELGPGQAPHPPHKHTHEEILMLRTGMLDATINGKTTRVTSGSVVCIASNDEHGWRNPGPERAEYFVIALGKDS